MAQTIDLAGELAVLDRELKSARVELEQTRDLVLRLEGARNFALSMLHRAREEEKKAEAARVAEAPAPAPIPSDEAKDKIIPISRGKKEK